MSFWAIAVLWACEGGVKVLIFRCSLHEKYLKAKLLLPVSSDKRLKMKNAIALHQLCDRSKSCLLFKVQS